MALPGHSAVDKSGSSGDFFPMKIPIEDTYADILSKARRGLGLEPSAVATQAGISPQLASGIFGGDFAADGVRSISVVLGLHPDRVVDIATNAYEPAEIETLPGLASFNTVFDDMTVNSYLVWDESTKEAAAFDTGSDCSECLEVIERHGLKLTGIYLTHTHGDHVFDLDRFKSKTGAPAWTSEGEPLDGATPFSPGRIFEIGSLKMETRSTWGHSPSGVTYFVTGLSRPVAMVGDAVFAGSMGGGGVSYEAALRTNREEILTLPEDTVLCPGHGPLTTVGEQKRHNPFFAEH